MTVQTDHLRCHLGEAQFMGIAQLLVGHQMNSIQQAMTRMRVIGDEILVKKDLENIGVFRCRNCGLWYWEDQMIDQKYCTMICGGSDA